MDRSSSIRRVLILLALLAPLGCSDSSLEPEDPGIYRSDFDRLFLVGDIPLLDEGCAPFFTYVAAMVLAR
jgi:hypothetical protein